MKLRHAILLAVLGGSLHAADYHVAPTGSDAASGTSPGSALATVAAALVKAGSGDRVLLERGGTYRGTFTLPAGRTLTAYGTGALPIVTISTVVAPGGGTIKTASVASAVRALWIDGTFAPLARFPNSGWLTVDDGTTATSLVDAGLSARTAGHRFGGGQVRWRRWSWWWETRPITTDVDATHLTIGGTAEVDANLVGIGSAYYIDNVLAELDRDREWFWGAGVLSVQVPAGASTVEVATTTEGIIANGGTIDSIAFCRFAGTALSLGGPTTVRSCEFRECDTDAIAGTWNAYGSLVTGCTFRDIRNNGVQWIEDSSKTGGTIIERNVFERVGMQYGYGGSGAWHACGVVVLGAKALTIRLNRFTDVGYCGVILGSDGHTVARNVFVRCVASLNDGAAVYANCSFSHISENIVLDSVGNLETSHPWTPLGHGIWPEFLSDFHDTQLLDNTVYGCGGNGIFLPNNYSCTVSGNTCIDNRLGGISLSRGNASKPASQNHTLGGNVLGVVSPTRRQAWTENLASWANPVATGLSYETGIDYGAMSTSTFVMPTASLAARTDGGTSQTAAAWQAANGSWAGSATAVLGHPILLFNDTESTASIAVPAGTWHDLAGATVGSTVAVAAYRSVVLVGASAPPATPAYYAASGTDYRSAPTPPLAVIAPAITADPAAASVTAPAAPGMHVAASGTQPLSWLWQRQAAGSGTWATVAGATGPVLDVATSVADDGSSWRCQVSNAAGTALSASAILTVAPAPVGSGGGAGGGSGSSSSGGGGGGCGLGAGVAALLAGLGLALAMVRAARP